MKIKGQHGKHRASGKIIHQSKNQLKLAEVKLYTPLNHITYRIISTLSANNDSVPNTQKSCVVYEFSCGCKARYVGRTTQRLADRIKQHVPTSIREKSSTVREQPPRMCKNISSKINCGSVIGKHLITNLECAKTYTDDNFGSLGKQDRHFI